MVQFDYCINALENNKKFSEIKKIKGFSYGLIEESIPYFALTREKFSKIINDDLFFEYLAESFRFMSVAQSEAKGRRIFIDNMAEYMQQAFYGEEL